MSDKTDKEIKPVKRLFFINGDLIKLIHSNRASNIVEFYNASQGKNQTMLYTDFKKFRRRAYTVANAAKLLNRSRLQFGKYIASGLIPPPIPDNIEGKRGLQIKAYYSEDHIF